MCRELNRHKLRAKIKQAIRDWAARAQVGDLFSVSREVVYGVENIQTNTQLGSVTIRPGDLWQLIGNDYSNGALWMQFIQGVDQRQNGTIIAIRPDEFLTGLWVTPPITANKYGGYQNLYMPANWVVSYA